MYAISNYNKYENVIYSQDAKHKLKLYFNGVDYETITSGEQDADDICERLKIKSRIIPFGSKVFRLENFISKEVELILHDIDLSIIQEPISISIGTLVENEYVYVPMGVFNIQDKPTTDKGTTTFLLRDNSVKFDFGYNAQPLIESLGGSATKRQILEDICLKAGVEFDDDFDFDFIGADDPIGIYDNSKTGRNYVSYIAGQGGAIAIINRLGKLQFIYINNLTTVNIPMWYIESYKNGDNFKISRVVYESGIIKYEAGNDTNDTLYLDASNPYVSSETQVQSILNIVNNFEINSFSTGRVLGNPAIDSYDLISTYDEDTDTTYTTLACNELTYNGVLIQTFDSEISLEARQENVTIINNPENFKKWATTQIDNVKGEVQIYTGKVDSIELNTDKQIQDIQNKFDGYTPTNRTALLETSVLNLQNDTYTKIQIDTKLTDGSVTKLKSTLVTTDDTGTTWDKNDSNVKTNVDADGLKILDKTKGVGNEEVILEAKYDTTIGETVVRARRITVEKYLVVGTHSRFEDYETGTGCFYLR